jgi:carbonic anhydrase
MRWLLFAALLATHWNLFAADPHGSGIPPGEALELLKAGNDRYSHDQPDLPKATVARRIEVALGQHPFAVIVGCADSRVPPETVFDQGLGDLFVVRTAGNVVSDYDIASIEYAVKHLGSRLIVVLGHEKCGAVDAAVKQLHEEGRLPKLLARIAPAVEAARKLDGDLLENSVQENVRRVVAELKRDKPVLDRLVKEGKIEVTGAVYDLNTGRVTFLD